MLKDKITQNLKQALKKMGVKEDKLELEHPANMEFGDYSTSVAMKLAKTLKKNPFQIASEIVKNLPKDNLIDKIDIIKPGFINFWLTKKYLLEEVKKMAESKTKDKGFASFINKKIIIEYTDPNLFKEFHIGHLYSNIIGESLARLYEASGAKVKRANYQGDVGMHVAKAVWGMTKKIGNEDLKIQDLEKLNSSKKAKFMGESYALGTRAYEENNQAKQEIVDLNTKIYNLDPSIKTLYEFGRRWSLNYFETIYKKLGTNFDFYYFEREAGKFGLKYVKDNIKTGVFSESKGAIIFDAKKYGLHARVFINSFGFPTYEAKDLGLTTLKYKDYPYDQSIIVVGNEIKEYFRVVLKALEIVNPNLRKKTFHVFHGMVRLPEGKMSSRTGNVVTVEWIIEEIRKRVNKLIKKSDKISKVNIDKVIEKISFGAIKYSLLKTNIGHDVIFDFIESLSLEGNSGPYLQYTYVRTQSVLKKSNSKAYNFDHDRDQSCKINQEEDCLIRTLCLFPEIILNAAQNFAPNFIANYLFDLAQKYNLFYQKYPILKAEKQTRVLRLLITKATGQIIKKGLYLLGIETVDRM